MVPGGENSVLDVIEFVVAIITFVLFAWYFAYTLYIAIRTGVMHYFRPPSIAIRQHHPVAFWVVALSHLVLFGLCLTVLFLMLVVPFIR